MEELLEILENINPVVVYETCDTLIDDHLLDSFAILSLISDIEDTFDVSVLPGEIVPANFNSAKAIWAMIQKMQENE